MPRRKSNEPSLLRRKKSCISFGPSMLNPTRKSCPLRNSHQDSSSSSPLVCKSFLISFPLAYFCCSSTAFR